MKKILVLTILALTLTLGACGQPTAEPIATVAVETPDATIPPTTAPAGEAEAAATPAPTPRDQAVGESSAFTYAVPESQGLSSEAMEELVEIVSGYVQDEKMVGSELLVLKDRRIVLHEAFGWQDRDQQLAMSVNSIFGSLPLMCWC